MKPGKRYEELIHKIYRELEPHAEVRIDDKIMGSISGIERQIDVSIRTKIAGHDILIIVQAKDHKRKGDVNMVGEFNSVVQDVNASKGILICSSGFTRVAKETAKKMGIDVCSAHDANSKQWQTEIKIPIVKKSLRVDYDTSVKFTATPEWIAKIGGKFDARYLQSRFPALQLMKSDGTSTTIFAELVKSWENNSIDRRIGKHKFEYNEANFALLDGVRIPVSDIVIEYTISERCHFNFFSPDEYRGIKTFINETFRASFLRFDKSLPLFSDKSWIYVFNCTELAFKSTSVTVEIFDFGVETYVRAKMD